MRQGEFSLYYEYGIDDTESNINWLLDCKLENALFEQTGAWYKLATEEKKIQGSDNLVAYIEENNLEEQVRQEVGRLWDKVHKDVKERKPKIRIR